MKSVLYSYYVVLYNRSTVTFVKILKRNNIRNSECVTYNSLYIDMDYGVVHLLNSISKNVM